MRKYDIPRNVQRLSTNSLKELCSKLWTKVRFLGGREDKKRTKVGIMRQNQDRSKTKSNVGHYLDICWTNSGHRQKLDILWLSYISMEHQNELS